MTAETTAGRGENAPGGTVNAVFASICCCTITDRRPYVLPPGAATTRSANSRWTMTTARAMAAPASMMANRSAVVIW